jgi:hypothetical protein
MIQAAFDVPASGVWATALPPANSPKRTKTSGNSHGDSLQFIR